MAPDVELDPMTADTVELDLFRSDRALRERDLTKSLNGGGHRSSDRPSFTLRYNLPEKTRAAIRDRGDDLDDDFEMDFPIKVGGGLVSKLSPGKRGDQVRGAKAYLDKLQETELDSLSADLAKLGIDWAAPPKDAVGPTAADYDVRVSTDRTGDTITAGDPLTLTVAVKNRARRAVYQLRAVTKSDGPYWDEKELAFGRILPGETRTASVPLGFCDVDGRKPGSTKPVPEDAKRVCKIPKDANTRQDIVRVQFSAEGAEPPRDAEFRPTIHELPRPIFAYNYQVVDNRPGDGDGQIELGEGVTIYMNLKNVGKGPSFETQANLRNVTGDGLLLHAGRFDVSNMKPGEIRNVAFTFDVLDSLGRADARTSSSASPIATCASVRAKSPSCRS